jgi:hypothetical protein
MPVSVSLAREKLPTQFTAITIRRDSVDSLILLYHALALDLDFWYYSGSSLQYVNRALPSNRRWCFCVVVV